MNIKAGQKWRTIGGKDVFILDPCVADIVDNGARFNVVCEGVRYSIDGAGYPVGLASTGEDSVALALSYLLDGAPAKSVETNALDIQIGGSHYKDMVIQPVEFIHKNRIGFIPGNVIKYVCRADKKGGVEDLKKARHYIDLLIEIEGQCGDPA